MAKTKTTKASFERNWAQKQLIEQFAGKSVAHRDKTKYYRKEKHKKSWLDSNKPRLTFNTLSATPLFA